MDDSGRKPVSVVIAIEIGNVNSGYAYCCLDNKARQIFTSKDDNGLPEDRVPSTLLLNKDSTFNSFGTGAQDTFLSLVLDNVHHGYKFFDTVNLNSTFHQTHIYFDIISYLYKQCKCQIEAGRALKVQTVVLVITVQGNRDEETTRQILCSVASKVDIEKERVKFFQEIDAAAKYCLRQYLISGSSARLEKLPTKHRFMIVDLGGSKIQYRTYEVLENEQFQTLSEVTVKEFGSKPVTENFFKDRVGDKWTTFKEKNIYDYTKTLEIFEQVTRNPKKSDIWELPKACQDLVEISGCKRNAIIQAVLEAFDNSLREIFQDMLQSADIEHINSMLLVGGLSESFHVREIIKSEIESLSLSLVLVPEPSLAILKGAVMQGVEVSENAEPDGFFRRCLRYACSVR